MPHLKSDDIKREYRLDLPGVGNKVRNADGSLTIRDARMLASGTWTDSLQKTACHYSPELLRANAGNWVDNGIWSRHPGGMSRSITDKVGIADNFRFLVDAVVADINIHCMTQKSKDVAALVEAGLVNYVSSELMGTEHWDAANNWYEATDLTFTGAAIVNRGACTTCTFEASDGGVIRDEQPIDEGENMDETEINAKIGDAKKELSANFDGQLKASLADTLKVDAIKELSSIVESQDAVIKELEVRLKVIEDTEMPPKGESERRNEVKTPAWSPTIGTRGEYVTMRW